jgi:hypothetical protein
MAMCNVRYCREKVYVTGQTEPRWSGGSAGYEYVNALTLHPFPHLRVPRTEPVFQASSGRSVPYTTAGGSLNDTIDFMPVSSSAPALASTAVTNFRLGYEASSPFSVHADLAVPV